MPPDTGGAAMMRQMLETSLGLGACPATGALICFSLSALATRVPGQRALWLRRVSSANWLMATMLLTALALSMAVLVGAWLTTGFEQMYLELLLAAVAIILLGAAALRMRLWLRSLAARARRAARRFCGRCGYDISGFDRCPECGTDRWAWLADNRPSPAQRRVAQRRGFAPPE